MIVKNIHSNKDQEVSFHNWFYKVKNKKDFIVLDWDLVYWQIIEGDKTKDQKIIDRDHAIRIIKNDDIRNTLRELKDSEWLSLKSYFSGSPKIITTAEKKKNAKIKKLVLECYKEGLTFDDFHSHYLKRKLTRDYARTILRQLYNEGKIGSLPIDLSPESSNLAIQDSNFTPRKKQQTKKGIKQKFSLLGNSILRFWKFISSNIGIGIFIVALLSFLTVRGCL